MKVKESTGQIIFNIFNIAFMLLLMIACLYPVLHVVFASLSSATELLSHRGILLKPLGFSMDAYKAVFENPMIIRGYANTIFIVVVGVTLNIIMTAICAYFLSRKGVMLKGIILFMIIFTMFFGGGLIPTYLTVKQLGLLNTYWALILPSAISTFNMIIMRTAFMGIPDSLEESAKIDGASHFTVLWRIIFPLSLPVVAVLVLYYSVSHWNSWFSAMIYIKERSLYPLQIILREILIQNDTSEMTINVAATDQQSVSETIKYAVIVIATLPILCLYPFLQKYFVKGVMIGSVKG